MQVMGNFELLNSDTAHTYMTAVVKSTALFSFAVELNFKTGE